jgi:hypothetical protein
VELDGVTILKPIVVNKNNMGFEKIDASWASTAIKKTVLDF